MSDVFLKIVNMSLTASLLVLAVVLVRLLFFQAPKWIHCLLWGVVALRLVMPFSVESMFSLIPSAEPIPPNIDVSQPLYIQSGIPVLNGTVNPLLEQAGEAVRDPLERVLAVATIVWLVGAVLMLLYGAVSYARLRRQVRISLRAYDNVFFCDDIDTPFILGIVRPRIYIPSGLAEQALRFVIEHEQAHLKRRDHLIKPFGFLLLCVYWFNPVIWVAYILLCRDIEKACDETVVKDMDAASKKGYSEALVACSTSRRLILACPLAFGEVGVRERIRSVLHYKKPAFWIIVAAVIASVVLSVCFLTNPAGEAEIYVIKDGYTDCEGVDVAITQISVGENDGFLDMEWQNLTGKTISYGEEFHIYRRVMGLKIPCKRENDIWYTVMSTVEGESATHSLSLWGFDLSAKGTYVVEKTFQVDGDENTYTAYLEFCGEENTEEPLSSVNTTMPYVTWTYNPGCSATFYVAFPLHVDLEYTHILATCDEGYLWGLETEGQPRSKTLRFETGQSLHWTPDGEAHGNMPTEHARILFTVYDSDTVLYEGTVSMIRVAYDGVQAQYEASLQNSAELQLSHDLDGIYGYEITLAEKNDTTVLVYADSVDVMTPTVTLWKNGTFQFSWSYLSSYLCMGTYELTEKDLILTSTDGLNNVYRFKVIGGEDGAGDVCYVFDAQHSSPIPQYRYAEGSEPQSPVPDGAVFSPRTEIP